MSDTPRTDAAVELTSQHRYDYSFGDPNFGWVTAGFARELERENAVLRADKELLDSNTIWLTVDQQPVWFDGCDLRKAIRRAMEEKQP